MSRRLYCTAVAAVLVACDDGLPPPGPGVDVQEGPCGHALYVLATNYESTSVSIVGWDGSMLSAGVLRSSDAAPGLSVALSGDVVAPTERVSSGELVLLDRYPASVITLFDPATTEVSRQINVQTGFAANPQDVIVARPDVLYVSRYERNLNPGQVPFDDGSDVLVVDAAAGEVTARIDLAAAMSGAAADLLPRPNRMLHRGGFVYVLLNPSSASFATSGDARIAVIDPSSDTLVGHTVLTGARGCLGLAASPNDERLAVACSGTFGGSNTPSLDGAGIHIFERAPDGSLTAGPVVPTSVLGNAPPSFSLDFASPNHIVTATFGELDTSGSPVREDRLLEITISTNEARELTTSDGEPFSIGDVRCGAACGTCIVADASRGGVHRFDIEADGRLGASALVQIDDGTGLPPRYLGAY